VLGGLSGDGHEPRGSFVGGEQNLAVGREADEIAFPMAGLLAIGGLRGTVVEGDAVLDVQGGTAALAGASAALEFAARQVAAPGEVFGAPDLGVDEAVDALVADRRLAGLALQPAGHRLRRPALGQGVQHRLLQARIAFQPAAAPAPRGGLLAGVRRLVGRCSVALQLSRDA